MIDIILIQKYTQFIRTLSSINCQLLHFITYRKNKIAGMPFDQVLHMSTYLPQVLHMQKIIIENDNDKYIAYKNNVHHWTTKYVWEKFISVLMNALHINFNPNQFVKIPYVWNTCDFSYHNLQNTKFKIKMFDSNKEEVGDHEILRNTNNCPYMILSCYHSLFKLAHCSGIITNLNNAILQRVVVNCDSMAIPIIPILACFCKNMLIIDNRSGKKLNYMKMIIDFKPTHYIALFTEENFLFNQKHINQIL